MAVVVTIIDDIFKCFFSQERRHLYITTQIPQIISNVESNIRQKVINGLSSDVAPWRRQVIACMNINENRDVLIYYLATMY